MGHLRLGALPRSREWAQVVELIMRGGGADAVAAAALVAADEGFQRAADDEGLGRTVWLLTQLPLAARHADYVDRLRAIGLSLASEPGLLDLVGAFTDAVDQHMRLAGGRTDFGEMAQMAAAETLTKALGERSKSLFGTSAADVQHTLGSLATTDQFGAFARDFFGRLTRRYLTFFLSRELSNHVGGERRFANAAEHAEFNGALDLHCRQASRIVEEFAGSWFSKTNWESGIAPDTARGFAWVALKKVRAELRDGGGSSR